MSKKRGPWWRRCFLAALASAKAEAKARATVKVDLYLKQSFPPTFVPWPDWMADYPGGDFFSKLVQRVAYERGRELLQPLPRRLLRSLQRRLAWLW